ncbi:hypothetical protein CIB84_016265 [Bambusicola thoracicus]|uniref:Uncharacterized protein n=1 Tax=Bambusicola thoracicus TaxID=9083 RepID=A0A2P4S7A6_BAMTH|nr:hypothetical protein CIB84_016265 [Bambusicola thoracicus]
MAQAPTEPAQMNFFPLRTRKTQLKKLQFSLWTNLGVSKRENNEVGTTPCMYACINALLHVTGL